MIVSRSRGHALTSTGADPVAMTTLAALIVSAPPSFLLDEHFGGTRERPRRKEFHAVGFEERLHSADVGVYDVGLEFGDALAIDVRLGHLQPDLSGVIDMTDHFADVQQRFGRECSPS